MKTDKKADFVGFLFAGSTSNNFIVLLFSRMKFEIISNETIYGRLNVFFFDILRKVLYFFFHSL